MWNRIGRAGLAVITACLLSIGGLNLVPSALADGPGQVPSPWVHETHEYNVPVDNFVNDSGVLNEKWSLEIRHGDILTLLMARNMVQNGGEMVDYTFNIHNEVDGTTYISQFMIMNAALKVGGQTIMVPLTNCDGFVLSHTPIQYDGEVPWFYCNITYQGVQVYPDTNHGSTIDLTLCHRVMADWDRTDIKVEALFDFTRTTLIDLSTGSEVEPGTSFAAEIHYGMIVHKAHAMATEGPIIPTGYTNDTLQYNLTLANGTPLTFSKLEMKDEFMVYNATGGHGSVGYSTMEPGASARVVHGFPGLVYGDTVSMKSDPEITVFHARVTTEQTDGDGLGGASGWMPIAMVGAIAAVLIVLVVVLKKRKAP